MLDPYLQDQIENWVHDFTGGDRAADLPPALRECSADVLVAFMQAACGARNVPPGEIEQSDVRAALLEHVARLNVPATARPSIPSMVGDFLSGLQDEGRLADGRTLGAFARALGPAFQDAAGNTRRPHVNPGSALGRNDPCPCGSGLKYKKCCQRK